MCFEFLLFRPCSWNNIDYILVDRLDMGQADCLVLTITNNRVNNY